MLYSELVTEVQNYTENTFAVADINTFITQAEFRIYNTIQFPSLRKNVVGTMTIGSPYLQCPSDFLAVDSISVIDPSTGAYTILLNKDSTFMREAYPTPASTGVPKYYSLYSSQIALPATLLFQVGPTPDKSYSTALQYFYYPESITTAASGTSWLSVNFPPVLLYGTLVEAYTMMKGEDDILKLYDGKYKEAIVLAKRLGDGLQQQDAYRSGQARMPVS